MFDGHVEKDSNIGRVSCQSDRNTDSDDPFHLIELAHSISDAWINEDLFRSYSVADVRNLIVPKCHELDKGMEIGCVLQVNTRAEIVTLQIEEW